MPFVAPYQGYFMNNDWTGLAMWALNGIPYLYLEYDGLTNRPSEIRKNYKDDKTYKTISRDIFTNNRFGLYMLFTGGISLFVDAFSHDYLHKASNFETKNDFLGNTATAIYLSIVSGGGGQFYRGNRYWGYFYFHLNNILLYKTFQAFSSKETYNATTDRYEKHAIDRTKAYTYLSIFAGVKIIEILHTIFTKEDISNGEIIEESSLSFTPAIIPDEKFNLSYGAQINFHF